MKVNVASFFDSTSNISEYVQPVITSPTGVTIQNITGANLKSLLSPVILKGLGSGSKTQMYNKMYKVFSDDLSLKGVGLLKKASVRKDYMKACLKLDDSVLAKYNVPMNVDKYSLLAMLAALACTGIKNILSTTLTAFEGVIGPELMGNIVEPFMSIYTGKDIKGIVDDIHSTPSLASEVRSSTLGNSIIGSYERNSGLFGTPSERAKAAGDLLKSTVKVLPGIGLGSGKHKFNLDLFHNTEFGNGIKRSTRSTIPTKTLSTTEPSPINLNEAISLF